jgi:hypothetical protein
MAERDRILTQSKYGGRAAAATITVGHRPTRK